MRVEAMRALPVALAVAGALTLTASSAPARVHIQPPGPQPPHPASGPFAALEVRVEGSALATGPARLTVAEPGANPLFVHELHTEVQPGGGVRAHVYTPWASGERALVTITDQRGHSVSVEARVQGQAGNRRDDGTAARVFVGTSAELGQLSQLARIASVGASLAQSAAANPGAESAATDSDDDLLAGFRVVAPETFAREGCNLIVGSEVALVTRHHERALTCAAHGGVVFMIGAQRLPELAGQPKLAGQAADGRVVPWGAGRFVAVASLQDAAALIAQRTHAGVALVPGNDVWPRIAWQLPSQDSAVNAADADNAPVHIASVLLLGVFLVATILAGVLVARRPRRPWVTWLWFPALALATTTLMMVMAGVFWHRGGQARVTRLAVLAPSGVGYEVHHVVVDGGDGEVFRIETPWRGAIPVDFAREHRFGSPFARTSGSLKLIEYKQSGRATIDGLTVGRLGYAQATWSAPAQRMAAIARRTSEGRLVVENRGHTILTDVHLCLDGFHAVKQRLDLRATWSPEWPGDAADAGGQAPRHPEPYASVCETLEPGSFALAAQEELRGGPSGASTGLSISPRVPTETRAHVLVVGAIEQEAHP